MNSEPELTIFEKMLSGDVPCKVVYEDEHTFAFKDIQPQAPVHVLIILKTRKFVNLSDAQSEEDSVLLGRLLFTAKKVAEIMGIKDTGYRIVINNGSNAHQTVQYLHCHVIGGRSLGWPPG